MAAFAQKAFIRSSHSRRNRRTPLNGNCPQKSVPLKACWEKCTNNGVYLLLPHSLRTMNPHTSSRRRKRKAGQVQNNGGQRERGERGRADRRTGSKRPSGNAQLWGKTSLIFTAGPLCN
ncbi:hypothetical protein QQF64_026358 [Cirrhinus molitorella]|uniref:Uncharacterized protein n=1 Tax=Cirrhinus molitorella TaxID=172907 RepID=A0ABR3N9C2_9TELE